MVFRSWCMADIVDLRPVELPPAPLDNRAIAAAAPEVPDGFYGSVLYTFHAGVCTLVEVREKVKP